MNTYITDFLKAIKTILVSDELPSHEFIDSTIDKLEMMKMEIEQHITNMSQNEAYENICCSANHAVQKLSEILELFEEFAYDKEVVYEIIELIDDISY